jgi:hypothetical protein
MTPEAAKQYKPRRTPGSLDDVITPEIRAKRAIMMQDVKDKAMQDAAGAAYDKAMPVPGMKKGGTASSRADGCCTKGKTRGTMVTMKGGGSAC